MADSPTYLDELNPIQRQAVETTDGPVLIVAGPGSGKTRVLTYRIAHLIDKGIPPWQILTLTFTNKAAREMKERIEKVVGSRANNVWAGTFHSVFARILRVEAEKIGYPSSFTIYDTDDSKSLIGVIIKEMNFDKKIYNVNTIRNRISSAKSKLITPKLYAQDEELLAQDRMSKMPHLNKIYATYTARCKRAGAMDFDDLLYRLYELFQGNKDGVLDKYRAKFPYVLVDEFQDTNELQYAIIRKLVNYENSKRNICVVGDDAQSIYAFRGATIQNILDYEKDFKKHNIQVFKLEQNYRSTSHIVEAANAVILNNSNQIQKKIWSDKGDGQRINIIKARTDGEEGKRVADTILEQKNRDHLQNKEIAILYRTNAQSRVFEEYLRRYNITYKIFGGQSFYQRKEVKDLLGYLRLVINPKDEEALRRVINYPRRGIGKTTIDKLSLLADSLGKPMWECMPALPASARAKNSMTDFMQMIKASIAKSQTADAYEVAISIARKSGLYDLMKSDTSIEGMNRLENLNALLDGIKTFVEETNSEDDTERSLTAYIQNIALLTDFDENTNQDNYVTLMSVHAAKGLEFKSIFIVGLEEKLFPSFMSMDTPEGMDEERRLFYVAITRAELLLTLSYAESRFQYGNMRFNPPSRFLAEIPGPSTNVPVQGSAPVTKFRDGDSSSSSVKGNFKKPPPRKMALMADPKTFKPSPSSSIQTGMKVLHLKFGEGKVISIDGGTANRVATIFFSKIDDPQKRIMLKFAKLQIL
jgi:DNA helicase-2/ATP-dependent DNA helicase PcrA